MGISLIGQILLVQPAAKWILDKNYKQKGVLLASAFLIGVSLAMIAKDWQDEEPNYYQILRVETSADDATLKRAYRTMSKLYHPDKNPSENAVEEFRRVKDAYDILKVPELRRKYDKFGPDAMEFEEASVLVQLGISYCVNGGFLFLVTMGKRTREAREWTLVALFLLGLAELCMKFSSFDPLARVLDTLPIFEQAKLFHALFPAVVSVCVLISAKRFVPFDIKESMTALSGQVSELRQEVAELRFLVGRSTAGLNAEAGEEQRNVLFAQRSKRKPASSTAQAPKRNFNWLYIVGAYFVINYLLK